MKTSSDTGALERLLGGVLLTGGNQTRHLVLGKLLA